MPTLPPQCHSIFTRMVALQLSVCIPCKCHECCHNHTVWLAVVQQDGSATCMLGTLLTGVHPAYGSVVTLHPMQDCCPNLGVTAFAGHAAHMFCKSSPFSCRNCCNIITLDPPCKPSPFSCTNCCVLQRNVSVTV